MVARFCDAAAADIGSLARRRDHVHNTEILEFFQHAAACTQFGIWETALEYAGVDVQRLVRNRKASPRTIRSGIRRLAAVAWSLETRFNTLFGSQAPFWWFAGGAGGCGSEKL